MFNHPFCLPQDSGPNHSFCTLFRILFQLEQYPLAPLTHPIKSLSNMIPCHALLQNLQIDLYINQVTISSPDKALHLAECCGGSTDAPTSCPQGGRHPGSFPKRKWARRPKNCMLAFSNNPVRQLRTLTCINRVRTRLPLQSN